MTGIQAIVFDAFGTLCDIKESKHPYGRLLRHSPDRAAARERIMTKPWTLREAAEQLGICDDGLIASIEDDLAVELASVELYPEVLDVLYGWKETGVKIAVASNLAMPYARPLLKLLPFELDVYAWSFDVGHVKPRPLFYEWVCKRLGGHAATGVRDTVLWIGDSLSNDYHGPLSEGMRAVLIERPELARTVHSELMMTSPKVPHPSMIR